MTPPATMVKIPSYLKGLVEKRARTDAYVLRLEAIHQDIGQRLATARAERDAADTLIRAYDPNLRPDGIVPIQAWRGKYGKRGEKLAAILEFVRNAYPAAVTTSEVAWHLALRYEIDVQLSEAWKAWKKTSVRNQLRTLAERGTITRLELDEVDGRVVSTWRWTAE